MPRTKQCRRTRANGSTSAKVATRSCAQNRAIVVCSARSVRCRALQSRPVATKLAAAPKRRGHSTSATSSGRSGWGARTLTVDWRTGRRGAGALRRRPTPREPAPSRCPISCPAAQWPATAHQPGSLEQLSHPHGALVGRIQWPGHRDGGGATAQLDADVWCKCRPW